MNVLGLELYCYKVGWKVEHGGLGKAGHFKKIAQLLWGPQNKTKEFFWHPWADKMNEAVHEHQYVAFNGSASSGKTDYAAIYAIVNWLCDPLKTLVLVTTTGLKDAERRIWGAIGKYWMAAPNLPGKIINSKYVIRSVLEGKMVSGQAGIDLVASEKKKEKEAVSKLLGAKAERVILIADELPEIPPSLLDTVPNLLANPFFQMLGIGNFKSRDDSFGVFVRPKNGYDSITIEDEEWETEKGWCVRFDGMKSPNIMAGKDIYKGIYDSKTLWAHRKDYGETSAQFWRMCRSFEAPISVENVLYSEADFISAKAFDKPEWAAQKTKWSTMDPAFTNGGDRCVQMFGWYGKDTDGRSVLCFERAIPLRENVLLKGINRDYQIARQFRDNCINENILPQNTAMDATGAGAVLHSIICEEWSYKVLKVEFWGSPSDLPTGSTEGKTGKQEFDRRVSELWGIGRQFLRSGQWKGMTSELTRELKARRYDTVKGPDGAKTKVETKVEMKERLGFSPDYGDSWVIATDLARVRWGFTPAGALVKSSSTPRKAFMELAKKHDAVYSTMYSGEE